MTTSRQPDSDLIHVLIGENFFRDASADSVQLKNDTISTRLDLLGTMEPTARLITTLGHIGGV